MEVRRSSFDPGGWYFERMQQYTAWLPSGHNLDQLARHPEADDVVRQHGRKTIAHGRTQVARVVQPGAATQYAAYLVAALLPRAAVDRRASVIIVHHILG